MAFVFLLFFFIRFSPCFLVDLWVLTLDLRGHDLRCGRSWPLTRWSWLVVLYLCDVCGMRGWMTIVTQLGSQTPARGSISHPSMSPSMASPVWSSHYGWHSDSYCWETVWIDLTVCERPLRFCLINLELVNLCTCTLSHSAPLECKTMQN